MKNFLIGLGVLVVLGVVLFGWYKNGYNHAIVLDEQVKSSWAQTENQLQRQFDLIPNVLSTVKGYAAHEEKIFTDVTQLRSQWASASSVAQKVDTATQQSGVLSRLIAVSENYPALQANQSFQNLIGQLEGAQNRIVVERMRYNQSVQMFNAYQRSFFGRFFCSQTGLTQPAVYFKVEEKVKDVPQVNFNQ